MKQLLSNIVLFCGGVNVKFLRDNCPDDRHKFYPIGLGVIVTASLAFISMMFATNAIFGVKTVWDEVVLILFSLFWGFAIFTIDWGLIKTMKKSNDPRPTFGYRMRTSIPVIFRLLVAVIISFSISRPLEVKIYEKRLRAQIETDRQDYVAREMDKKDEKVSEKTASITDLTKQGDGYLEKKNKSPETETFKINLEAKQKCDEELKLLRVNNAGKIASLNRDYNNLGSRAITPSAFTPSRNSEGVIVGYTMLSWASSRRRDIVNVQIPNLNKEVSDKAAECEGYAGKVSKEQEEYQADYATKIKEIADQVSSGIVNRDSIEVENRKAINKIIKASYVSFDTLQPGLITQLESISNFEKTPEGKSAGMVRLILLLVIICIDTAPIVIKLLTKRGVYEEIQDEEEERLEFLSRHESYANKHLIQHLSQAQREVLTEAIRQWKEGQKERDDLADEYVDSNQRNNA